MNKRHAITAFALTCLLGLSVQYAQAHAMLEQADPGAGRILEHPPEAIVLRFDSKLELPFCHIRVEDASGRQLDDGRISFANQQHDTLQLALPLLPSGTFHVLWSVVSRDGHRTQGDFHFTLR
ncbi:MAG: copper resistance protein CopC [Gammaproteobacteria bacterium]